jgi:hypothetical protein
MPTPEKKVKGHVAEVLTELGAYWFYPATGGYGRNGVPDIVACWNGRFIGIECKAGSGKVTALQERELGRIEDSGGISLIYREPGSTPELLKILLETMQAKWRGGTGEDM